MTMIWLIIVAVMLLIEIFTMGLTTIWFSFGAALAAIVSGFGGPVYAQILVFCIGAVATMLLVRPYAVKVQNRTRTKTNVEELAGQEVTVLETIDNRSQKGLVRIHGVEWMARSVDGSVIEEGENVIIESVSGVKLMVRKKED